MGSPDGSACNAHAAFELLLEERADLESPNRAIGGIAVHLVQLSDMLTIVLTLLIVTLGSGVLLAIGAAVLQGLWYSEPVEGIAWRSAASAAAVGLFFAAWCGLESAAPDRYDTVFAFTPRETQTFDQFWSVRKSDRGQEEILYRRSRSDRGTTVFVDESQRPWRRSDGGMMIAIIVEENGERKRFDAELTTDGHFNVADGRPLRFVEAGGSRSMTENALGQITTMRYGLLVGNLLWNLLHLLVWFLCLWLLMRFQWPHALLLAAVMWLVFSITVWPVVKNRVRRAARETAPASAVQAGGAENPIARPRSMHG